MDVTFHKSYNAVRPLRGAERGQRGRRRMYKCTEYYILVSKNLQTYK